MALPGPGSSRCCPEISKPVFCKDPKKTLENEWFSCSCMFEIGQATERAYHQEKHFIHISVPENGLIFRSRQFSVKGQNMVFKVEFSNFDKIHLKTTNCH